MQCDRQASKLWETSSGTLFWESMILQEILCIAAHKAMSQLVTIHLCHKGTEVVSLPKQTIKQHQNCTLINQHAHRLTKVCVFLTASAKLVENSLTNQYDSYRGLTVNNPFPKGTWATLKLFLVH